MKTLLVMTLVLVAGCASKQTAQTGDTKSKAVTKLPEKATVTSTGEPAPNSVSCKKASDERTIQNVKKDSGSCEVQYTKFGQTSPVANAVNSTAYCDTVASKIRTNLESAGWTCTEN